MAAGEGIRETESGVFLQLRVKPRSLKNRLAGWRGHVLLVDVRSAPADGEANAAVLELLARELRVARSSLEIVKGHKSRDKTVCLRGRTQQQVLSCLPGQDAS